MNYNKGTANAIYGKAVDTIIKLQVGAEKAEEVRADMVRLYGELFKEFRLNTSPLQHAHLKGELHMLILLLSSHYYFRFTTLLDRVTYVDDEWRKNI